MSRKDRESGDKNVIPFSEEPEMSVEDIFFKIRKQMGHTWEAGTFNQGERPVPTVEGQAVQTPKSPFEEKQPENPFLRKTKD